MSKAEEAAKEYANKRCLEIQKARDSGIAPYPIRNAIEIDFFEAVKWVMTQARKLDAHIVEADDDEHGKVILHTVAITGLEDLIK